MSQLCSRDNVERIRRILCCVKMGCHPQACAADGKKIFRSFFWHGSYGNVFERESEWDHLPKFQVIYISYEIYTINNMSFVVWGKRSKSVRRRKRYYEQIKVHAQPYIYLRFLLTSGNLFLNRKKYEKSVYYSINPILYTHFHNWIKIPRSNFGIQIKEYLSEYTSKREIISKTPLFSSI